MTSTQSPPRTYQYDYLTRVRHTDARQRAIPMPTKRPKRGRKLPRRDIRASPDLMMAAKQGLLEMKEKGEWPSWQCSQ